MRNQRIHVAWLTALLGLMGLAWWWLVPAQSPRLTIESTALGQVLVFERSSSGHYRWRGKVGGVATEFLIDTGAARTTIPKTLADQAGLQLLEKTTFSTASGKVQGGIAQTTVTLEGGLRLDQHRVAVIPDMGTNALLGMDVLTRLRVEMAGNEMRVRLPSHAQP